MEDKWEVLLDPTKTPDAERQAAVEKLLYSAKRPDPEIGRIVIAKLPSEPVEWIQTLEAKLLKKLPFDVDVCVSVASLLSISTAAHLRLTAAQFLRATLVCLADEKRSDGQVLFEEKLSKSLISFLETDKDPYGAVWLEVYKTLTLFRPSNLVSEALLNGLVRGGDDALYLFAQYAQRAYPPSALKYLIEGFQKTVADETAIHILRAMGLTFPKEGPPRGYPSDESVIRVLIAGLKSPSENVRKEAAVALTARAKSVKGQTEAMPLEDEVWDTLFDLYQRRLSAASAADRDHAKEAIRLMPVNPDRLSRLFVLLRRVQDELQKQNVVDLIGTFKTPETRAESLKMLRVNFSGLRLEAQKTTIDAAYGFAPDDEIEAELEKLLEGKGLHADIQARLADKLFSDTPSLSARLARWLDIDPKKKRPVLERFELPIMHIKIIEAAGKRTHDATICKRLIRLTPLLMMNDAKIKCLEVLRGFPDAAVFQPRIFKASDAAKQIIAVLEPLPQARIVFDGFTLPEVLGGSKELEYGDMEQAHAQGLGSAAAAMGKGFVKKLLEDIFDGSIGDAIPEGTSVQFTPEGNNVFTLTPVASTATHH